MTANRPTISEMLQIQSVAIVGVSAKLGYYWAHSMLQWPHDLQVHLVSRRGGEVLGQPIYQDLSDIPNDIDYAILAVPHKYVEETLRRCSEKGAKGATIFSSGYSELGTEEGRLREKSLKELVMSLPTRVLGPNCMGLCYPRLGFAFMPTAKRLQGKVGFLSQSGGVAIAVYTAGAHAGVGYSKLFSFGNQIDITPREIIDYFVHDDETEAVGAYLEGTPDARGLLQSLEILAKKKSVVVLKGGRTAEGTRAASSHTGALAGKRELWSAAFRQVNVPTVRTVEDLVATLSIFSLCPVPQSRNIGIIAISGGNSVIYTDLCIENGLGVPEASPATVKRLESSIRDVGTGLKNPIDLAADYYKDQTTSEVIRIAGEEERFSSLIIEVDVHDIHQVASIMGALEFVQDFWDSLAKAGKEVMDKHHKPVLIAIPEVAYPESRAKTWNLFVDQKLPVFHNFEEAVSALSRTCDYYERRKIRNEHD